MLFRDGVTQDIQVNHIPRWGWLVDKHLQQNKWVGSYNIMTADACSLINTYSYSLSEEHHERITVQETEVTDHNAHLYILPWEYTFIWPCLKFVLMPLSNCSLHSWKLTNKKNLLLNRNPIWPRSVVAGLSTQGLAPSYGICYISLMFCVAFTMCSGHNALTLPLLLSFFIFCAV